MTPATPPIQEATVAAADEAGRDPIEETIAAASDEAGRDVQSAIIQGIRDLPGIRRIACGNPA